MEKEIETIKIRSGEIRLIEGDIVEIKLAANHESTIADVDEINTRVITLVGNKKHYILVITQQGTSSSHEAREHAAQESMRRNVVAEAIVISNIAVRLLANVYMKVNRPKQKIKLFNTREKAMQWLHQLKAKKK